MTSEAEPILVRRAMTGDRASFEELVRRTARSLHARVLLETRDPHRAEDLVQETYLAAWQKLAGLESPEAFRGWLWTLARNASVDAARRSSAVKRGGTARSEGDAAMVDGVSDGRPDPAATAVRNERCRAVIAALADLPEEYRMPLTLRHIAGADYAAIRAELGLSDGALRGLLHRGGKLLRTLLEGRLGVDGAGA